MLPLNGAVFCRSVWVECKERKAKGEPRERAAVLSCDCSVSRGPVRKAGNFLMQGHQGKEVIVSA